MTLVATGELDIESARLLRTAVDDALATQPRELILDLSALTFIDSSGLATIVDTSRQSQTAGVEFGLLRGDGHVREVLQRTKLDSLLRVLD